MIFLKELVDSIRYDRAPAAVFSDLLARLEALGIPVEGVVLITSVDMLWDYAATALNSTGYLAATCLLPGAAVAASETVPAPEPAPEPAG